MPLMHGTCSTIMNSLRTTLLYNACYAAAAAVLLLHSSYEQPLAVQIDTYSSALTTLYIYT
jgi:hypothetical protein